MRTTPFRRAMMAALALIILAPPLRLSADEPTATPARVVLSCPDDPGLNAQLPAVQAYLEPHTGWTFRRGVKFVRKHREKSPVVDGGVKLSDKEKEKERKARQERRVVFTHFQGFQLIKSVLSAEKTYSDFMGQALSGSYNEEDETLTVIGDDSLDLNVIVHELHHALAHQTLGSLRAFRGGPEADPELDMARLGVLEGAAMLAERNFPKWVNDRSQAVPTPETLRVVRNGLLREIRQTYTPADSSAGRVVLTGNLREFQAVQTDLMFPYTWGTYYVQRFLQARQGDWQRRYHELFDPERAPRTTREIIRGEVATSPESSPQVDLGKVIERWIEANPKWRPVGRPSRVGALLTRLWTGAGVTPAAAAAALGAHDDWYAIIEIPGELEPNEVAGLATLTFGSEAEAELFIAHLPPTEDGNPGKDGGQDGVAVAMVRIGRLVVAPLGRCPTPLFAAAVDQAGGVQLPPPPATTDGAIAELGLFRDEETPGRHERVVNALAMVVNSGDTRSIASVGRALFEPDRDLRKADEENLDREIELGRRLADGFARRLSHDGVGALAIAAVVSLEGRNSPPVNRLTATRYLIAVREQLDPDLRRRAGAAVARSFAHRPDVASTASVLLDPNIRRETRAGSTPEVTR